MRPLLTLLIATLLSVAACGDDAPADDAPADAALRTALRAELLRMLEADQRIRTQEAAREDWERVEKANTERISQILDQHGWPGYELVGKDGAHAAWVLVQHADRDLDLQRRGLAMMRQAVEKDDADPSDMAFLVDRVRVAEGKQQVYGTQWETTPEGKWRPRTPIADEANVDERRAAVGLKPLQEYLEELQEFVKELPSVQ